MLIKNLLSARLIKRSTDCWLEDMRSPLRFKIVISFSNQYLLHKKKPASSMGTSPKLEPECVKPERVNNIFTRYH